MNHKNLTRNTMPGGFWRLSKPLLHLAIRQGYDGAHAALFFEDLLQQEKWVEDNLPQEYKRNQGFFFLLQKNSMERTGLSTHKQRLACEFCQKNRLLEIVRKGIPAKNFYKVNHDRYQEILAMREVQDSYVIEEEGEIGCNKLNFLTSGNEKIEAILNKENTNKENNLSSGKSTAAKTFRESLKMSGKEYKKKVIPEYHQFTLPLITFWNDCAGKVAKGLRPSQHSTGKHTVTLAHIDEVTRALASGAFAERYPAEAAKCQTAGANNIPDALLKKVWTLEDMKAALQSYFLHYEDGYWPHGTENKKKLPRSLATVMLSSRADTRPSWLLSMAANPPQPKEELLDPLVYEVVVKVFTKYGKAPSALDRKALQGAANALYREYQRIDKSILPACTLHYYSYFGTLQKFLSNYRAYLEYLFECERDGLRVVPGMFRPGTKTWEGFVDWMREQHSVIISFGDNDPETWGGNRLQNVQREFRQEVHKKGLETARKWYGDRIPYLTYEEQQEKIAAWKDKYPKEDRRSMLWGIQLYHEIMGKRK